MIRHSPRCGDRCAVQDAGRTEPSCQGFIAARSGFRGLPNINFKCFVRIDFVLRMSGAFHSRPCGFRARGSKIIEAIELSRPIR
jgi:hypothetical protein